MPTLNVSTLKSLSHDQLLLQLRYLITRGHNLEAELVAYLGEVDARRLYLEQACPSMFHYCVHVLRFAEGVAYKRIAVARAAREFPQLLAALRQGDLHLTAESLLAPHLDRDCAAVWLAAACHKTTREIKQWIADRKPKADVRTSLRKKVPARRRAAETSRQAVLSRPTPFGVAPLSGEASSHAGPAVAPAAATAPVVALGRNATPAAPRDATETVAASSEPLGADRYCVRFTIDAVAHAELQELRALLRHQIPDGDVGKIIERAVHMLLERARRQKRGAGSSRRSPEAAAISCLGAGVATTATATSGGEPTTTDPGDAAQKKPSRRIPVVIRRAVWERDEGRCRYVSREGRQCGTRDFLEFHHQVPWARCWEHRESNIALRCRAHNQHAAELDFGPQHMAAYRNGERNGGRDGDQRREAAFAAMKPPPAGRPPKGRGNKRTSGQPNDRPRPQLDLNPVM